MKNAILVILILSLNIAVYSQSENKIYKKVIDKYALINPPNIKYSSKTLIIVNKPFYMRNSEIKEFPRFKEKYKKLDERTFDDFVKKNQEGFNLENDKFSDIDPDISIVIVNQEQSKNRKELFAIYPNWNRSIIEFSNIGFNKEKDQAFVYYGYDSGPGVGGGYYIVFEKKRKKWKEKAIFLAWAA